jgi:c-di-GMP-binding flagellar brake protein YcgR
MANASALSMHLIAYRDQLPEDFLADYQDIEGKIGQFLVEIESARTSRLLTAEGKDATIRRLKEQARAEFLPSVQRRLQQYDTRREQLLAQAIPPRAKDDARRFHEVEIRQALRGNDPLQNQVILLEAVEIGDAITVWAILDAPVFFKLVTPEARDHALEALVAKSPQGETLRTVQHERAVHAALYEAIVYDIDTAAQPGVPGPAARRMDDPLRDMARGDRDRGDGGDENA